MERACSTKGIVMACSPQEVAKTVHFTQAIEKLSNGNNQQPEIT